MASTPESVYVICSACGYSRDITNLPRNCPSCNSPGVIRSTNGIPTIIGVDCPHLTNISNRTVPCPKCRQKASISLGLREELSPPTNRIKTTEGMKLEHAAPESGLNSTSANLAPAPKLTANTGSGDAPKHSSATASKLQPLVWAASLSRLEFWSWIAGIASAAFGAIGFIYSLMPQSPTQVSPATQMSANAVQNQIGTVSGNVTIVAVPTAFAEKEKPKLAALFSDGPIGRSIPYIESIYGPARSVRRWERTQYRDYQIDGCKLTLEVGTDDQVSGFTLNLSEKCTFEWRHVLPHYADLPSPNTLTMGQVMRSEYGWRISASCLGECGNSLEPRIDIEIGGSHADNWITAHIEADFSGENFKGGYALIEAIEKQMGRRFLDENRYECNFNLSALAKGTIDSMRPNRITIRIEVIGDSQKRRNC